MDKKQLWLNLKAYQFSNLVPAHLWDQLIERFGGQGASGKAFASKIALKLGWENKFAVRAISEYKKFVFLGVVSDFAVTPSKIIDQVWHEHILFSKAYREFCTDVIQFEFNHNPELFPMTDQTNIFNAQYLDTLALYQTEFAMNPPDDIWSIPKYDPQTVTDNGYQTTKKILYKPMANDMSLHMYFDSTGDTNQLFNSQEFGGFDDGSGGGAGASGSWDSDGGDSGGDGGSGCSSGCGGGD